MPPPCALASRPALRPGAMPAPAAHPALTNTVKDSRSAQRAYADHPTPDDVVLMLFIQMSIVCSCFQCQQSPDLIE